MQLQDLIFSSTWKEFLKDEFLKEYFKALSKAYFKECENFEVFPPQKQLFSAFSYAKPSEIKVVLLGQDPYHTKSLANGLSFSVASGLKPPPSLRNIFKELESDLGVLPPSQGSLESWARQGVLLMNSSFSVRKGCANSHSTLGWSEFTKAVIKALVLADEKRVFILWGKFAQKFESLLAPQCVVIKAAHPSPFSASKFFGSKPFSRANAALSSFGKSEVTWGVNPLLS